MTRREVEASVLAKVRAICAALEGSVEERAWVGVRWQVRKRTYAHVLVVDGGAPASYAKAAGTDGPATVLTFRSAGPPYDALCAMGPPFWRAPWGVTWGAHVVGVTLEERAEWPRLAALLAESHRLLAPRPRKAR